MKVIFYKIVKIREARVSLIFEVLYNFFIRGNQERKIKIKNQT